MWEMNDEQRYAAAKVSLALIGIEHLMMSMVETVGLASSGGGPHVPVPPKLAELVENADYLARDAEILRVKAREFQALFPDR